MTHMKLNNRQRLGFLAELGWPMNRIAEDMGWCAQTITDELRNRRVDNDKRRRRRRSSSPERSYGVRVVIDLEKRLDLRDFPPSTQQSNVFLDSHERR